LALVKNGTVVIDIDTVTLELTAAIAEIMSSEDFAEFKKLAKKSDKPFLKNRPEMFEAKMKLLGTEVKRIREQAGYERSWEYRNEDKRRNKLTELEAMVRASIIGIKSGSDTLMVFDINKGNRVQDIEFYEADIEEEIESG
jgi:hypothetical protein